MPNPDDVRAPSLTRAMWWLLFSEERYVQLALQRDLWINIQSVDLRARYEAGTLEDPEHAAQHAAAHKKIRRELLSGILRSALAALVGAAFVLCLAGYIETPPITRAKWVALTAGAIGLWAGLLQLSSRERSWTETRLDELLAGLIVKALVFVAAVLALLAGVMS